MRHLHDPKAGSGSIKDKGGSGPAIGPPESMSRKVFPVYPAKHVEMELHQKNKSTTSYQTVSYASNDLSGRDNLLPEPWMTVSLASPEDSGTERRRLTDCREAVDMTITLNLYDHLLSQGRKYEELGRVLDALRYLTRLASIRDLPEEVATECQTRLGKIQLKRRRFLRARHHLGRALEQEPENASLHHLSGLAYLAEGRGDQKKALAEFQRALELDENLIPCMVDTGLLMIKLGKSQEGLLLLRRAGELAPDDSLVIGKLARGLRRTGQGEEARRIIRLTLFRNPRSVGFRKLWNDCQYQMVRQEQERKRMMEEANNLEGDTLVLLPFLRPEFNLDSSDQRLDPATGLPGPHVARMTGRPELKHVQ